MPLKPVRTSLFIVVIMATSTTEAGDWTPPKDPNPREILNQAQADTRAGRYEAALAKHVWFHEHALETESGMYGVRLSFALGYWADLGEEYPPALEKLKEYRDEAQASVLKDTEPHKKFHDLVALNKYLNDEKATQRLFRSLDADHPDLAQQFFELAEPALISGKDYELVGKYISPEPDFAKMKDRFVQDQIMTPSEEPGAKSRWLDFVKKTFVNDATTLVAILAVNKRQAQAEAIATAARSEYDDASFHKAIEKALTGEVPVPWP
jgi:hypothetical protein